MILRATAITFASTRNKEKSKPQAVMILASTMTSGAWSISRFALSILWPSRSCLALWSLLRASFPRYSTPRRGGGRLWTKADAQIELSTNRTWVARSAAVNISQSEVTTAIPRPSNDIISQGRVKQTNLAGAEKQ